MLLTPDSCGNKRATIAAVIDTNSMALVQPQNSYIGTENLFNYVINIKSEIVDRYLMLKVIYTEDILFFYTPKET